MSVTSEKIQILRRESNALRNPFGYRLQVFLIALLGYAFIAFTSLFALALALAFCAVLYFACVEFSTNPGGAINAARLLIPALFGLGAFLFAILRALCFHVAPPRGKQLQRGEAVPLFQELDRLRAQMSVPCFDRVYLDSSPGAAVASRPRLGLFGWQEYSIIIGIPLMAVLSPDQFRAVLAHEMGHISPRQGRFDAWVWRQWQTWFILLQTLTESGHRGAVVFIAFFNWFAPVFDRHTFVLRRINEIESDRIAAQTVGAQHIADALLNLELFLRSAREKRREPLDRITAQRWINDALSVRDDLTDVHPSLAVRLRAVGQPGAVPEPHTQSALARYLGHRAKALATSVGLNFTE